MEKNSTRYGLLGDARRLGEILSVAGKYKVTQGLTPEKVCNIFKDLGTAFIKTGQLLSLHPEVLPKAYCKELESLRNAAPALTTIQIREIISEEYGRPWNELFQRILPFPIGCASIAQVHEAVLLDGTHVAVKVQRPDSYQMMEQDIRLLKKALSVLKIKQIENIMWFLNNALDETWRVAQQEMDFYKEAENIERLGKILEPMAFAAVPKVYHEYTRKNVLVMEYIDGIEITDHAALKAAGYDLSEVCQKLIRSYIKQWAEDLFFQADPHSGNLAVRDGQIIWYDLGMMGELTEKEANALHHCMHGIWKNDVMEFTEWGLVLMGKDPNSPFKNDLARDFTAFLDKYRVQSIHEMNETGDIFVELFNITLKYNVEIPVNLTMYGRSLLVMEGTVSNLDQQTDLADIIGKHLAAYAIGDGMAGKIARKLSHNKLISGGRLRCNAYEPTPEDEVPDEQLLTAEEYQILAESGSDVWTTET